MQSFSKTAYIFLTVIILLVAEVYASSNYSLFGIGDVINSISAAYNSMGGTSIAMPSEHGISTRNPAIWSYLTSTRVQVGYRFNQSFINSEKISLIQNNSQLNGIFGLFNIDTAMGISLCIGLHPYTNVNYSISNTVEVRIEDKVLQGQTYYSGSGGISEAFLGGSVKIFNNLSVGAAFSGNIGIATYRTKTVFYDNNYFTTGNRTEDSYLGFGFNGGIFYKINENLSLGAFYKSSRDLKIKRSLVYSSQLLEDTSQIFRLNIRMPDTYGIGISYAYDNKLIGADFSWQDFSGMDYQSGTKAKFNNSYLVTAGFELGGSKSPGADYFEKTTFRIGASFQKLYYTIAGTAINEYFGSAGFSVPIAGSAIIDAALIAGSRGTNANGLIQENFLRLTIDLSIGDSWFKPFKREY